jgi:hypothetical protein
MQIAVAARLAGGRAEVKLFEGLNALTQNELF